MNSSQDNCPHCGGPLADGLCPQCLLLAGIEPTPTSSRARWVPPSTEELEAQLTGYQVMELLGHGGMGAVYKGWQTSLERHVAIKVLPPGLTEEDAPFTARFKHEARTMARLSHPAIVSVHDYGETPEGLCYIVMEFIEGTDVQRMMAEQERLPPGHALAIAMNVCDALVYAHANGIIHRDIKPANVMVDTQGRVRVADFGLAKATDAGATLLTGTNMAVGTPGYIAPETLIMGMGVDARADVYAVGVMLYAMLTGRVPHGRFEAASVRVPGLDPRFDDIINRAMQDEREARYANAAELRADLATILNQPEAAANGAPLQKSQRAAAPPVATRARPAVVLIGLAAAAVCAVGLQLWKPWEKHDGDELVGAGSASSTNPGGRGVENSQPPSSNSREVSSSKGPQLPATLPPELAILDTEFQKLHLERVTAPFDAEVAKLNASYAAGLEREMMKYKAEGFPDEALVLEGEKTLIRDKQMVPSLEEESADKETPERLKTFRMTYRTTHAKLEAQRVETLRSIIGPLVPRLQTLETDLTKRDRIADAKIVREYRESLGSALGGGVANAGATQSAGALKDGFTNTLGMKFTPVPGTKVLFCIHETRYKDYAAYAAEVPGVNDEWKKKNREGNRISVKDDDPVVGVNWGDAQAFCAWLSKKERRTYRLPTNREWSFAMGIGRDETVTKDTTPESLYPWGDQWPPPKDAGNFGDASYRAKFTDRDIIPGYTDGFAVTSPVMSYKPNKLGLYDMSGNVWEWCEDWYDVEKTQRVLRGGSWLSFERDHLVSSVRKNNGPTNRYDDNGFRVVVESAP